ncbi:uncharacterized protein BXZ73DRAFT_37082 [Epithele typhae]|uniref:uncharacterized protein n=1 Tax=Epithele typhae TaxID=378194 RepID=UPI0020075564|nr:uncharacterized protein BXZ73DRAFT_37082 [Epithele typhae]KAH9945825.1 hypothetical protein BXZ73DRAFT_37082 [Epithele typhae]
MVSNAALPSSVPESSQPPGLAKEIPIFEFTKRKRWADLLVTELNDTIILVLSETGEVWYCGNAVTELLGWRDDELVDTELLDLVNADDRDNFRAAFTESIHGRSEMLTYARIQCKNEFYVANDFTSAPREILFEIKGRPHHLPDTGEFKCYFAMAQPYPSRNTAMLNTFLELKMENERLQQRVAQLRSQSQAIDGISESPFTSSDNFGGTDPSRPSFEPGMPPELDDDGPRKKSKRLAAEQHVCVTCGRTDSPEWRKGPMGPKTLCNACGLRWAKKARKTGEGDGDGDPASGSAIIF